MPLSPRLLQELRDYWRMHRPPVWLFPGECADGTLCPVTVQRQCQVAAQRAGLTSRCTPHTLRHSYATLAGVDLITLQAILGHHDLRTTALRSRRCPPAAWHAESARSAGGSQTAPRPAGGASGMTTSVGPQRPAVEVADVIREYGEKFLARCRGMLTGGNAGRVPRDLAACRTAAWAGLSAALAATAVTNAAGLQLLSHRYCPQVPGRVPSRVARPRGAVLAPGRVSPRRLHAAAGGGRAVALARPALLYDLLFRAAGGDPARTWPPIRSAWGTQARRPDGAAHLGAEPAPSSACALCRDGGRLVVQRSGNRRGNALLAVVPARLFPAGARPQSRVPGEVPGLVAAGLLRQVGSAAGPMRPCFHALG